MSVIGDGAAIGSNVIACCRLCLSCVGSRFSTEGECKGPTCSFGSFVAISSLLFVFWW